MKLGIHAYAWTSQWTDKSLGLIGRAKKLGLDFIEIPLMDFETISPFKIKNRLDKEGMLVCTSTALNESQDITGDNAVTRRRGIEYLKDCVKTTARMGGRNFSGVIYSSIGKRCDERPRRKDWDRSADGLREVAKVAEDFGITLGIEPVNRYETYLINTCSQALKLQKMIGRPNVKIHLDTYHMNIEEKDFYKATMLAKDNLCHFHLCENDRGVPGTGLVDWDGIFKALAEQKYDGFAALESFVDVAPGMASATCVWRDLAPSGNVLVKEGVKFIKEKIKKHFK